MLKKIAFLSIVGVKCILVSTAFASEAKGSQEKGYFFVGMYSGLFESNIVENSAGLTGINLGYNLNENLATIGQYQKYSNRQRSIKLGIQSKKSLFDDTDLLFSIAGTSLKNKKTSVDNELYPEVGIGIRYFENRNISFEMKSSAIVESKVNGIEGFEFSIGFNYHFSPMVGDFKKLDDSIMIPTPADKSVPEVDKYLGTVNFGFDSIVPIIDKNDYIFVQDDRDICNARYLVKGYTDNVGNPKYNLALSQKRAHAIKEWLMEKGVKAIEIDVYGMGENDPVASNVSDEGRKANRRVDIYCQSNATEYF